MQNNVLYLNYKVSKLKKGSEMKLAEYLNENDLTHEDFARKSGVSRPVISKICVNIQRASMEAAIRIHRATKGKVTFTDLVGDELLPITADPASAPEEVVA